MVKCLSVFVLSVCAALAVCGASGVATVRVAIVVFFESRGSPWEPAEANAHFRAVEDTLKRFEAASAARLSLTVRAADDLGFSRALPQTPFGRRVCVRQVADRLKTDWVYLLAVQKERAMTAVLDPLQPLLDVSDEGRMRKVLLRCQGDLACYYRETLAGPATLESRPSRAAVLPATAGFGQQQAAGELVSLRAESVAKFYRNGVLFYHQTGGGGGGRGINLAVLHDVTGEIEDLRHYDTWINGPAKPMPYLSQYVSGIPPGRIVMTATADWNSLTPEVATQFQTMLGSKYAGIASGWDDWVMITRKGPATSIAEAWQKYSSGQPPFVSVESNVALRAPSETTPPSGTFTINRGAPATDDNRVILDLSGVSDLQSGLTPGGKMRFSNDGANWSPMEDYKPSATWYLNRGNGIKRVYAQFRDREGNWSPAMTREIYMQEKASLLRVGEDSLQTSCADDGGNVYLMFDDGTLRRSSDAGRNWFEPQVVFPNRSSWGAAISCFSDGHVYAARVMAVDSSTKAVHFNASSDFGKTWMSGPVRVSSLEDVSNYSSLGYSLSMCSTRQGFVYLAWEQVRDAKGHLFVRASRDFGKTWSRAETQVSTYEEYSSDPVRLACTGNGHLYVYWPDRDGKMRFSRSTDAGVSFEAATVLAESGSDPQIAADEKGNVYVAWDQASDLMFRRSADYGASWWVPRAVDHRDYDYNREPRMAADQSGNVYLFWQTYRESYTYPESRVLLFNRSRDYGATWLNQPVRINTNPYQETGSVFGVPNVSSPLIAVNNRGALAALWEDGRTQAEGRAKGTDIFMTFSRDFGATWEKENIRVTTEYPNDYAGAEGIHLGDDGLLYTFWSYGWRTLMGETRPLQGDLVRPEIASAGILNGASFRAEAVAPGSIASIFGTRLATQTAHAATTPLPLSLADVTVRITDKSGFQRWAGLFFVSPGQINCRIPPGTPSGEAEITVLTPLGWVTAPIRIATVAPGLFSANGDGRGLAAALIQRVSAANAVTFESVAEGQPGAVRAIPINLGPESDKVWLLLFGTGISGGTKVAARIGGVDVAVDAVAPHSLFSGLDQVNLRLTRTLAGRGEVDVELTVDGVRANPVTVYFK